MGTADRGDYGPNVTRALARPVPTSAQVIATSRRAELIALAVMLVALANLVRVAL